MIPRLLKQRRGEQDCLPLPSGADLETGAANQGAPEGSGVDLGGGPPGAHWAVRRRSKPVPRPKHNSLKSICNTVTLVTVVWLLTLVCAEYLSFHLRISACAWPDETEAWEDSGSGVGYGASLVSGGAPQLQELWEQVLGDVGLDQGVEKGAADDRQVPVERTGAEQGRKRRTVRVAVIGDPQLVDKHCYWFLDDSNPVSAVTSSILVPIVEFLGDIFMRKSFQLLQMYHEPEAVFFLGDLFDSGKILDTQAYQNHMRRFKWIFEPASISPEGKRYPVSSKHYNEFVIPLYNLTGNHDIGYDIDPRHQGLLVKRYEEHFGPINYEVVIGGVSFVGISAPTLQESTSNAAAHADTVRFMQSALDASLPSPAKKMREIAASEPTRHWNVTRTMTTRPDHPRVLLHHVPLWRPEGEVCEGERTRNQFLSHRVGYSYINVLPQQISNTIMSIFKPLLSLSGDDHDQCKMKHDSFFEHTVGTFSWMQGNLYPSYALLSVDPGVWPDSDDGEPVEKPRAELRVCFLPVQIVIFRCYGLLLVLSLIVLVIDPLNPRRQRRSLMSRSLKFVDITEKLRILLNRILFSVRRNSKPALFLLLIYFYLLWLAS